MFESIIKFFKKMKKTETKETGSKNAAKERLHLVLMQDRANVSADFLELMKQEIIEVIKKYIEVEEDAIDVRLTNEIKEDGTTGAPSLYANIPIVNIRNDMKKEKEELNKQEKQLNDDKENEKNDKDEKKCEETVDDRKEEVDNEDKTDKEIKEETEKLEEQKKTEEIKDTENTDKNEKNGENKKEENLEEDNTNS